MGAISNVTAVMNKAKVHEAVGAGFMAIAGGFVIDSLKKIIIWLIVMFSVIICDLIAGCRKSILMKEEVRFSTAWRRTMGKMVTYFSFVIMVVMINQATQQDYQIDKWAVLFVCGIEGCSIMSNILKPKGYNINVIGLLSVLAKKLFKIESEDTKSVITKIDKDESKKIH